MKHCDRCELPLTEEDVQEDSTKAMAFHDGDYVVYICAPCIADVYNKYVAEMRES